MWSISDAVPTSITVVDAAAVSGADGQTQLQTICFGARRFRAKMLADATKVLHSKNAGTGGKMCSLFLENSDAGSRPTTGQDGDNVATMVRDVSLWRDIPLHAISSCHASHRL